MTIRITGMNSGLDTEAIITELASARSMKVENIKKDQTKLSWKIDAWKELNTKIYDFYSDMLSDMRFDYAYSKKTTKVSNSDAVTIITGGDAMNGVQTLKISQIAKTGYLTGGQLGTSSGEKLVANLDGLDWLKDNTKSVTFKVKVGDEEKEITLSGYDNLNGVANKFKEAGLDAKYDESTHRFFITSKKTGAAANFTMEPKTMGLPKGLKEVPAAWEDLEDTTGLTQADYEENRNKIIEENNKIIADFIKADKGEANKGIGLKEVPELQEVPKAWGELTTNEQDAQIANGIDKTKYNEKRDKILEDNKARQDIIDNNNKILAKEAATTKEFTDAMKGLGLLTGKMAEKYGVEFTQAEKDAGKAANMIEGQDAVIELNGAKFTSATNTFEINGLTMTVHKETKDDEIITMTTEQDTDGIYDTIKNFFVKYNELINEMDKLYNAESASKYEPLTKEEKEALSDDEVEEWEKKIKGSLLRRDGTLSSVSSVMKEVMLSTFVTDTNGKNEGKNKYLSYFGIETLGYFKAKDNEKSAYHIDGDSDDSNVKNNPDKLKKAIASEPETVIEFFKNLSNNLYDKLTEKMGRTDYSSAFTVYNDKQMDIELKAYDSKIAKEQDKLNDYIDRWYKKFSQMEVALSKLNSQESSISSLFG